jgi:putative DNA methylase
MIKAPKKLIEVALPLDDINTASAREKSIRHGHPSTLHLWWARRPLAAARAVLFAQLVNDPGGERGWGKYPGQTKEDAQKERERLFDIIRDLVKWENTTNEKVLERARKEIKKSWRETCEMNRGREGFDPDKLPAFHDPFAGGGAIPLEAQRLGLEAYASDLNPVAVMINKAMIEIPPKFAGRPPANPQSQKGQTTFEDKDKWAGARGLADDVRYYGQWMRDEAFKRIGHLYPKVEVTTEITEGRDDLKHMAGQKLTVIAWIWARTVKSPNPAFSHADVPLVKSFVLSSKKGKETWLTPIVDGDRYHFEIKLGGLPEEAREGTKSGRGSNFRCILSDTPIEGKYIKAQGKAGRMGQKLLAIVAEGRKGRIYLPATEEMEEIAASAQPEWKPSGAVPKKLTGGTCYGYGLDEWGKLFTNRQLVALNAFSELVAEAREKIIADAKNTGWEDDRVGVNDGGSGATAYGDAVAVNLVFAIDKMANLGSSITSWMSDRGAFRETFARQAIPMVWDFAEANPFSNSGGNFMTAIDKGSKAIAYLPSNLRNFGLALQQDAVMQPISNGKIISTDPPYYDNIGYADLSDFFYVWMRRSLRSLFPDLFATMLVPKAEELIASQYRHGGKRKAESFFLEGMTRAIRNITIR